MFSFLVERFPNGALLGVVAVVDAGDRFVEHVDFSPAGMDIGAKEIDRWHKQRGFKRIRCPGSYQGQSSSSPSACCYGGD